MKNWTEGPWSVVYGRDGRPRAIRGIHEDVTRWNPMSRPASLSGLANANLIAAAPDLYEALEQICEETSEARILNMDTDWWALKNKAQAALAKARGEGDPE